MLLFLNLYSLYCSNSDIEGTVQYQSFISDRKIDAVDGSLLVYGNEKEEVPSRTLKNLKCFVYDKEAGAESLKNFLAEEIFDTLEHFKSGTIISFELENFTFEEELEYKIEIFDKITEKNLILKLSTKDLKKITKPLNGTNSVDLTVEAKSKDPENEKSAEIEVEVIETKNNHGVGKKNEIKWERRVFYHQGTTNLFPEFPNTTRSFSGFPNTTDSFPDFPDSAKSIKRSFLDDHYAFITYSIIICFIFAMIYFLLCCVPIMSIVKSIFGRDQ